MEDNKEMICISCKNELSDNEKEFNPCKCGAKICLVCFLEITDQGDNICPACNNAYTKPNDNNNKNNNDKTKKVVKKAVVHSASKTIINRAKLENARVIQKNLVYVIGLSPELAKDTVLKKAEYFGQYGRIEKVVINKNKVYNPKGYIGPSYSAYITYSNTKDSSIALLSIDHFTIHDRLLRASFGTTKYCSFFLKNQKCTNKDCLYLHEIHENADTYDKDDINDKKVFLQQQRIAINLSKVLDTIYKDFEAYVLKFRSPDCIPIFPPPELIYKKHFSVLEMPLINLHKKRAIEAIKKPQYKKKENGEDYTSPRTSKTQSPHRKEEKTGCIEEASKLIDETILIPDIKEEKEVQTHEDKVIQHNKENNTNNTNNHASNNKKEKRSNEFKEDTEPRLIKTQSTPVEGSFDRLMSPTPHTALEKKNSSRFDFANNEEDEDLNRIEVPKSIQDIIELSLRAYGKGIVEEMSRTQSIDLNECWGSIDHNNTPRPYMSDEDKCMNKRNKDIFTNKTEKKTRNNKDYGIVTLQKFNIKGEEFRDSSTESTKSHDSAKVLFKLINEQNTKVEGSKKNKTSIKH